MKTNLEKDTELHDKINRETGRVAWSELQRHFASGSVVWVSSTLDLIDVALRIPQGDQGSRTIRRGHGRTAFPGGQ